MRASAREPSTREEAPKPISSAPEQVPFLSGNQALHGGEHHIIGKADAGGGDDAVAEVEHGQLLPVQPGGQYKADARQSAAQGDGQAGTPAAWPADRRPLRPDRKSTW